MEKFVIISTKPFPAHEEGISLAVQNGFLFRSHPELNELYKEGYRIKTYMPAFDGEGSKKTLKDAIKVHLVK